ncbi:MAG: hypothetical protein KKD29_00260 [Candidatus Omnitrophica bacterium]|nr:hypothetical protein [Candidatus Omnitrophota bacterium]MBU4488005.1 hypothetical protein [Candidatus Omnitrophota bacterium]MCG2704753.1 hypothetical protein [Candidatus Omnitrophota bacterium]
MIEINLLPHEIKRKRRKIELPDISFLPVLAGFLGVIIIIHLFVGLMVAMKAKTFKGLERKWQSVLPNKEEADNIKAELTSTRTKIDTIDKLIETRRSWAVRLNDISDSMIPGVWLNKLWLEKRVIIQEASSAKINSGEGAAKAAKEPKKTIIRTLHLNGSVIAGGGEETAVIGKFIRSLKDNKNFMPDFSDIESASIQRTKLKDAEVMDFELICYFK